MPAINPVLDKMIDDATVYCFTHKIDAPWLIQANIWRTAQKTPTATARTPAATRTPTATTTQGKIKFDDALVSEIAAAPSGITVAALRPRPALVAYKMSAPQFTLALARVVKNGRIEKRGDLYYGTGNGKVTRMPQPRTRTARTRKRATPAGQPAAARAATG